MKRLKCLRSMVAMVLLLGMSSLSAQNSDYPGNYAKAPRFKALLCYSETAEPAHVEFGHQAVDFFKDLTVGNGYILDVATSFSGYDYDKLAAYDVVIAINTIPGSKGERDAFEEYIVYHPKFLEWMKINNIEIKDSYTDAEIEELISKSPYAGATSNDIDWLEKVRMQGNIQKWVDHSISVTINLPSDVSEELVAQLYAEAWRSGCKGCTVYRDGCRSGVLVSISKKEEPVEIHPHVIKRPIELEADVVRFQNNKEKWIAFVGLLNGNPYEIFTGLADDDDGIFCPKSVNHGKIIKAIGEDGVKRYDFQFVNKRGYKTTIEGLSDKFNPEYWNYAKLISGVLRYGMPIDQVLKLVSGLELDSQSINTWKMGVERALKKYLPNGTKATGQTCPNCGQETLIYQEGCLICTACGTSKCG